MEEMEVMKRMDNDKLTDIVKNYKYYGYDDEIRNAAINLLCERGWTISELQLFGYLSSPDYDEAVRQYEAYCRNSKIGICLLIFSVGILSLVYLIFIFLAYRNVSKFYRALARDNDTFSSFNAIGIITYFHLKERMKEELKGSR